MTLTSKDHDLKFSMWWVEAVASPPHVTTFRTGVDLSIEPVLQPSDMLTRRYHSTMLIHGSLDTRAFSSSLAL